ncbi:hypothetical protein [Saccharopolyspora hattusasensis]|uniref:hypothetical protein n=1 Tax=Saccharopolyspora hattusasensis TaxID=1128679 RepID=UPI003D95E67C
MNKRRHNESQRPTNRLLDDDHDRPLKANLQPGHGDDRFVVTVSPQTNSPTA